MEGAIDRRLREHRSPNYAIGFAAWRAQRSAKKALRERRVVDFRMDSADCIGRYGAKDVVCGGCGLQYVAHSRSRRNRLCGLCWVDMQRSVRPSRL